MDHTSTGAPYSPNSPIGYPAIPVSNGAARSWGLIQIRNTSSIARTLNLFLTLEMEQVALYTAQSRLASTDRLSSALRRFAEIENEHVQLLTAALKRLGHMPSNLTRVGPVLGTAVAEGTKLLGEKTMLELNILAEQLAIKHYSGLANRCEDRTLREVLNRNLIDEEMHVSWMRDYLNQNSAFPWSSKER